MPDDLDTLQGTWTVTALQVDGRKMPPEALADASIVIKGRKFPQARKPQAGIFELKGDSLRICMSEPGKARPGEFASKAGDGRSFTSWRLARP
jgi:hypothetical protein